MSGRRVDLIGLPTDVHSSFLRGPALAPPLIRAARRLVQVGIRTLNAHQRAQATRFGVEIVEMRAGLAGRRFAFDGPLYVSIDLDAFDPAHAPGVSHHEPGGLTPREVIDVLLRLDAPLVGADVVELNPTRDVNGMTATLAAKLVKELAALASA